MFITGFSDLTMETPACHPGAAMLKASFSFDKDISSLFAHINTVIDDAQYFDNPHFIRFTFEGVQWAIFPDKGSAVPFETQDQAATYIKRLLDFLNDLHDKKDMIEPDHRIYNPVPVIHIYKILPGTNCKACGFTACMAFAAALSKGEISHSKCPDLERPEKQKELQDVGLLPSE